MLQLQSVPEFSQSDWTCYLTLCFSLIRMALFMRTHAPGDWTIKRSDVLFLSYNSQYILYSLLFAPFGLTEKHLVFQLYSVFKATKSLKNCSHIPWAWIIYLPHRLFLSYVFKVSLPNKVWFSIFSCGTCLSLSVLITHTRNCGKQMPRW